MEWRRGKGEVIGWPFFLKESITVTQVGWYDEDQDGLSRDIQVGLWRGSEQLLGSPGSGIVIRLAPPLP